MCLYPPAPFLFFFVPSPPAPFQFWGIFDEYWYLIYAVITCFNQFSWPPVPRLRNLTHALCARLRFAFWWDNMGGVNRENRHWEPSLGKAIIFNAASWWWVFGRQVGAGEIPSPLTSDDRPFSFAHPCVLLAGKVRGIKPFLKILWAYIGYPTLRVVHFWLPCHLWHTYIYTMFGVPKALNTRSTCTILIRMSSGCLTSLVQVEDTTGYVFLLVKIYRWDLFSTVFSIEQEFGAATSLVGREKDEYIYM